MQVSQHLKKMTMFQELRNPGVIIEMLRIQTLLRKLDIKILQVSYTPLEHSYK